jgi:hypothetical protein
MAQTPGIPHARPRHSSLYAIRHDEGRERRFKTQLSTCRGKKQSKQSVHLQLSSGYRRKL